VAILNARIVDACTGKVLVRKHTVPAIISDWKKSDHQDQKIEFFREQLAPESPMSWMPLSEWVFLQIRIKLKWERQRKQMPSHELTSVPNIPLWLSLTQQTYHFCDVGTFFKVLKSLDQV